MILYYGCYGEAAAEEVNGRLEALKETDSRQGELWEDVMDYWGYVNTDLVIHGDHLPDGLPKDDSLALVILGGALNPDGSGKIEVTSGDLSVPCFGVFFRRKQSAFFVFHC